MKKHKRISKWYLLLIMLSLVLVLGTVICFLTIHRYCPLVQSSNFFCHHMGLVVFSIHSIVAVLAVVVLDYYAMGDNRLNKKGNLGLAVLSLIVILASLFSNYNKQGASLVALAQDVPFNKLVITSKEGLLWQYNDLLCDS